MSGSGGPRGKHAGMSSVMRGKIPAAENPRFREPCWTIPCKTVLRTRAAGLDRWSADVGPVGGGGFPPQPPDAKVRGGRRWTPRI